MGSILTGNSFLLNFWRIDNINQTAILSIRIEKTFYQRCQPELRPAYLQSTGKLDRTTTTGVATDPQSGPEPTNSVDIAEKPTVPNVKVNPPTIPTKQMELVHIADGLFQESSEEREKEQQLKVSQKQGSLSDQVNPFSQSMASRSLNMELSPLELDRDQTHGLSPVNAGIESGPLQEVEAKAQNTVDISAGSSQPTRQYDQRLYFSLFLTFKKEVVMAWFFGLLSSE